MVDDDIPWSAASALAFVVVALVRMPIMMKKTTTTTIPTRNACDASPA
jgi:hypothetical protein